VTTDTAVGLDDIIRADGQPLGRFVWVPEPANGAGTPRLDYGDWLPAPDGTHHGYLWRGGFYCLKIEPGTVNETSAPPATVPGSPTEDPA
jgi:hypothetical protein